MGGLRMLRYKFYREWLQTRFQEICKAFAAAGMGILVW